jgi:nitroreductase
VQASSSYDLLLELVRGRRSVRRFDPDPLPDELVDQVLEAARWAPSAGNRQAYRLLVVRSREKLAAMAAAVDAATEELARRMRPELAAEAAAYLASFNHFAGAPLVIVPIYRTGFDLRRATDPTGEGAEPIGVKPVVDALASVSAAIMNLLLAAHALGLGSCWMTGPLCAARELSALLAVPRGWEIAALVPLGTPAEQPAEPPRRPLAQLVRVVD